MCISTLALGMLFKLDYIVILSNEPLNLTKLQLVQVFHTNPFSLFYSSATCYHVSFLLSWKCFKLEEYLSWCPWLGRSLTSQLSYLLLSTDPCLHSYYSHTYSVNICYDMFLHKTWMDQLMVDCMLLCELFIYCLFAVWQL